MFLLKRIALLPSNQPLSRISIRALSSRQRKYWSEDEKQQLVTHVREEYVSIGRGIDWDMAGSAHESSVKTCHQAYYKLLRSDRDKHTAEKKMKQPLVKLEKDTS